MINLHCRNRVEQRSPSHFSSTFKHHHAYSYAFRDFRLNAGRSIYITCYLDVSKVSAILHPVTFKFAYGYQSRGTSTASAALPVTPPRIFLARKRAAYGSPSWGPGERPVSHVPPYLPPCRSSPRAALPFLPYAYNTEITRKNGPMTVMRYTKSGISNRAFFHSDK